jgi:chromosome segregation ATPase
MDNEKRLAALELKVAEEARLRAIMDRDQSDLTSKITANTRLLQAVGTTQGEHSRMLTRLESRTARVEGKVDRLQTDVAVLKTDVAVLKTDVAEIKVGMRGMIEKLDLVLGKR